MAQNFNEAQFVADESKIDQNNLKPIDLNVTAQLKVFEKAASISRLKPYKIEKKATKEDLPDKPHFKGNEVIPATIENLEVILLKEGFEVKYNLIKKKVEISVPNLSITPDNRDNVGMTRVISVAARYGIATGNIASYIDVIADKYAYNPVQDWIRSSVWDGVDRLPELYSTVQTTADYPAELKRILLKKWFLSCVAAALMPKGFRTRGVLTLQGPQGINKTAWVSSLISDPKLREMFVKQDHHLDTSSKDSILGAISHWIVELGELDSSFKKDIARLKGFLTASIDKVRRPYAKVESEYPRRTVFVATVNDARFLVDPTGNSRWWTISVDKLEANHNIDMQQLFAQLAVDFENGETWWLTPEEEDQLNNINDNHQSVSSIDELIRDHFQKNENSKKTSLFTASRLLTYLDIKNPTNSQSKEAAATLRKLLGEPKKINGLMQWRCPCVDEDRQFQRY